MKMLRTVLAGLCAVLFVLTALAALLLFNLERGALNSNTYKQALASQSIYDRFPALVGEIVAASANSDPCALNPIACGAEGRSAEAVACFESALGAENYHALVNSGRTPSDPELQRAQICLAQFPPVPPDEKSGPPPFLANLSAEEWRQLITTLLPPAELKSLVDQSLDSVFAFVNGRADSAAVDMTTFKTRLTGPPGVAAMLTLLRAQPPCSLEQVAAMTLAALSLEGKVELCSPSDELAFIIQPVIEFNLQLVAVGIPDRLTLIPAQTTSTIGEGPMKGIRLARLVMRLSPLIPLLFLLAISAFAVRSLNGWLKWWGWPFLITGFLGASLGLLSAPVLSLLLTNILTRRLPAYLPASLVVLGSELVAAILRQMLKPVAWEAFLLMLVACLMLLWALRMDRQAARLVASEATTQIFHDKPTSTS